MLLNSVVPMLVRLPELSILAVPPVRMEPPEELMLPVAVKVPLMVRASAAKERRSVSVVRPRVVPSRLRESIVTTPASVKVAKGVPKSEIVKSPLLVRSKSMLLLPLLVRVRLPVLPKVRTVEPEAEAVNIA